MRFFQRACGVCAFLASSGSQVVATSPFFPTLMVYCSVVPFLGFYPCVVFVWATVALVTITAPILLLALRSAADVAVFSPVSTEPITQVNVSGNTWLKHGELLNLTVICSGSKPWGYCYEIHPGSYNVTGKDYCCEKVNFICFMLGNSFLF